MSEEIKKMVEKARDCLDEMERYHRNVIGYFINVLDYEMRFIREGREIRRTLEDIEEELKSGSE